MNQRFAIIPREINGTTESLRYTLRYQLGYEPSIIGIIWDDEDVKASCDLLEIEPEYLMKYLSIINKGNCITPCLQLAGNYYLITELWQMATDRQYNQILKKLDGSEPCIEWIYECAERYDLHSSVVLETLLKIQGRITRALPTREVREKVDKVLEMMI